MNNAIYLQSGGPTSVINASFYGVIKAYQETNKIDVLYGSRFGLNGVIDDDLLEISKTRDYQDLCKIPGAILGSARLCVNLKDEEMLNKILETCKRHEIKYIFVNGGNDSMDTGMKLNDYFKQVDYPCSVVGVCKTIDNDLAEMDLTPGFPSAVNYINRTIMEVSLDVRSYKKGRVTIIETMGRDAGWLAASSVLATDHGLGPDLIYVPEVPFSIDNFLEDVKSIYEKKHRVLVVVSEALKDKEGKYVFCDAKSVDSFGHVQLGSISKNLSNLVSDKLGYPVRNIEFNLMQRCAAHIESKLDQEIAYECGVHAVHYALENKTGVVAVKVIDAFITYVLKDFKKVANVIRHMPQDYMNERGNFVSDKGKYYFEMFKDPSLNIDIPDEFK